MQIIDWMKINCREISIIFIYFVEIHLGINVAHTNAHGNK